MAKTISLSHRKWNSLKEKIVEDYGRATVMISWRLRDQVGFTVREHRDYSDDDWRDNSIRLDFWDDAMQTMFLLKYSDYIGTNENHSS